MKNAFAFIFGALFSIGLMWSGMANPENVLSFLDIFGEWNASLMFVMLGAICVAFIPFQKAIRRPVTLFNEKIELPTSNQIDPRLCIGALIFGIGWGIAGICPAPAFTLIGLGYYQAIYFIAAMFIGVWLHRKFVGAK